MGLFADLILGEKCKFCGSRSLENYIHMSHSQGTFYVKYCRTCERWGVYGTPPRCYVCGTPQTSLGTNEHDVVLPKCPKCGYLYDGYDFDQK